MAKIEDHPELSTEFWKAVMDMLDAHREDPRTRGAYDYVTQMERQAFKHAVDAFWLWYKFRLLADGTKQAAGN